MPESTNLITIVGDRRAGRATVIGVWTASQLRKPEAAIFELAAAR